MDLNKKAPIEKPSFCKTSHGKKDIISKFTKKIGWYRKCKVVPVDPKVRFKR